MHSFIYQINQLKPWKKGQNSLLSLPFGPPANNLLWQWHQWQCLPECRANQVSLHIKPFNGSHYTQDEIWKVSGDLSMTHFFPASLILGQFSKSTVVFLQWLCSDSAITLLSLAQVRKSNPWFSPPNLLTISSRLNLGSFFL